MHHDTPYKEGAVTRKNLPFADGVFFNVETSVAIAFKTNAISVIRGLNK